MNKGQHFLFLGLAIGEIKEMLLWPRNQSEMSVDRRGRHGTNLRCP